MKKTISLFLIFTLIFQITSVSFANNLNINKKRINQEIEKMNEEKETSIQIIQEQLENQDMIVHLPIYEKIINEQYALAEIELNKRYNENFAENKSAKNSTQSFPRGGEVAYPVSNAGNSYGKVQIQYIAPKETKAIISKYKNKELETLSDLLKFFGISGLAKQYPYISAAITIYEGSKKIDAFLTSNTIRNIQAGTGASAFTNVETSYGKSSAWGVWNTYQNVSIPDYNNVVYKRY